MHIKANVHVDHIRVILVQLGNPDISHFGSLLAEDRSERPELCWSKGWILWEEFE